MSQEINNKPNPKNEEIDLIQLFNYFKNGIKSLFRKIGNLFGYIFQFIILLKKQWILLCSFILLGLLFGLFIAPMMGDNSSKNYEMVVQTNPISNIELYAFKSEINSQNSHASNQNEEGIKLAKDLGIVSMNIEPVIQEENTINFYFEQIESNTFRGIETDTLFFKSFDIKNQKSKMKDTDFSYQKISLNVRNGKTPPMEIQNAILDYFNNLPGIKNYQQTRLAALTIYEMKLQNYIKNIDTLMLSRAVANLNSTNGGIDQMLVNSGSRSTIEWDLMRFAEAFSKKLYGTQKEMGMYQKGVNIVSNLRSNNEKAILGNPLIRYPILGFGLGALIILLLQFNKFLKRYEEKHMI